jgi:hypothetical protein
MHFISFILFFSNKIENNEEDPKKVDTILIENIN